MGYRVRVPAFGNNVVFVIDPGLKNIFVEPISTYIVKGNLIFIILHKYSIK